MGFASYDQLIAALTAGRGKRTHWQKLTHPVTAAVLGEWSCLAGRVGNPGAINLASGTNLSFQSCCEATDGAPYLGGAVEHLGYTKHGTAVGGCAGGATSAPAYLLFVDLLGFYPRNNLTVTGAQSTIHSATFTADAGTDVVTHAAYDIASISRGQLTTTGVLPAGLALATDYWTRRQSSTTSKLYPTYKDAVEDTNAIDITDTGTGTHTITIGLPRYTDGAGVQVASVVTTVLGAGTPTNTLSYTNSDGVAGRVNPATLPTTKTAAAVGLMDCSGTGSGKYGPFWPLQGGDKGVRSIQSHNQNATQTSGAKALMLMRPLFDVPIGGIGVFTERDLINQLPSFPRLHDGACIVPLLYNGAATPANTGYFGRFDCAWN